MGMEGIIGFMELCKGWKNQSSFNVTAKGIYWNKRDTVKY